MRLTGRGVEAAGDNGGWVVFEVRSPYIIVGRVHELTEPGAIDDAATLYYRSLGPAEVAVSTDNGLTWKRAGAVKAAGSELIDLTRLVLGSYGYLVRLMLPAGSGLGEISLNTWAQLAPVSLPRLFKGENRLKYSTG
ncbi:MAG: hypothetical protein U9N45_05655, partial [Gemmatimonadota bacterium]|nr:hypothetical protein [Gemmatimonadota bacterium]